MSDSLSSGDSLHSREDGTVSGRGRGGAAGGVREGREREGDREKEREAAVFPTAAPKLLSAICFPEGLRHLLHSSPGWQEGRRV